MPFGLGLGELVLVYFLTALVPGLLIVAPAWRIVAKAGYAGALSLLLLVPLVNVVALFAFAFSTWPLEQRSWHGTQPPA